jgi:hypothetical protein
MSKLTERVRLQSMLEFRRTKRRSALGSEYTRVPSPYKNLPNLPPVATIKEREH